MSSNAQKTPVVRSLNRVAELAAADAIQLVGKSLPASVVEVDGSIVLVKFEVTTTFTLPQVRVPIATSFWRREPTQVGDLGVVRPSDASLGGINGLGSGTATLSAPANLAALVFEPVANAAWDPSPDPDAYLVQGPNGVILRTADGAVSLTLSKDGIVMKFGGKEITFDASGFSVGVDAAFSGAISSSGKSALAGGAKKVVLDGDPVVAGKVVASSTKTTAT